MFTKGLDGEENRGGGMQGLGAHLDEGLSSLGLKKWEKGGSGYLTWEGGSHVHRGRDREVMMPL